MAVDQEERVVDPDAQPDHGRQGGGDVGDADDVAQQPDRRSAPRSGRRRRVMIGIPIATIVPNAKLRMIIAATIPTSSLLSVSGLESSDPIEPAGRHLASRSPARRARPRRGRAWASLRVRSAEPMSQQHRDERGRAVLRELRRALLAEGARRADDVRAASRGPSPAWPIAVLVVRVAVELARRRRGRRSGSCRSAAAGTGRQDVGGPLAVRARQAQVVGRERADATHRPPRRRP